LANWKFAAPLNPLRVGIDLDGVLAQFDAPALELMRQIQPTGIADVVFDDITHPDTWGWPAKYGVTPATSREFWKRVCTSDTAFWNRLPVTSEVDMSLKRLLDGPDIQTYYVTSRPFAAIAATQSWLDRFGFKGTLIVVKSGTKGHVVNALGLHALIDDKMENLTDVLESCKRSCVPILLSKPWNKNDIHPYIQTVTTVREGLAVAEQAVRDARIIRS